MSLRTLQVAVWSLDKVVKTASKNNTLTYALSTIMSPSFSEVTIFYRDYDISGAYSSRPDRLPSREIPPNDIEGEALRHYRRFGMYRALRKVRGFRLVLCADVWDGVGDYAVRMLKEAVAAEKARIGFDINFPEPLVSYSPRTSRPKDILEGFWNDGPSHWTPL